MSRPRSPRRKDDVIISCSVNPDIKVKITYGNAIYEINAAKETFPKREMNSLKRWYDSSTPWVSISTTDGGISFFENSILCIAGKTSKTIILPRDTIGLILSTLIRSWETSTPQNIIADI